jgi:hypothetical protein
MTTDISRSSVELDRLAQVTLVAVPRERFGVTPRALEAVYANTAEPFHLVYVDAGSPARTRRYLAREADARGFTLVRTDDYLTPNEARNLGLRHVRTPYVVFIDNDVVPSPGWLGKLLECAETTRAWVVGPMYFIGEPEREEIHMAAGDAQIEEWRGSHRFIDRHRFAGKRPAEVRHHLLRMPCEQVEFHCMLVRMEAFEQLGELDEELRSVCEHSDFCLLVRQHGHQVYFEPDSVVTYTSPRAASDGPTIGSSSTAGANRGMPCPSNGFGKSGRFTPTIPGRTRSRAGRLPIARFPWTGCGIVSSGSSAGAGGGGSEIPC